MELYKKQKGFVGRLVQGFTLVEMLVAMSIFIIFTGVLISSYTDIVRSQREANEYRLMYSDARNVFETLVAEFRNGMVDYGYGEYASGVPVGGINEIYLVSKDDQTKTHIKYEEALGVVTLARAARDKVTKVYSGFSPAVDLNSADVQISEFRLYVSPVIDPYDIKYVNNDLNQFHPKITIYAEFVRTLDNDKTYTMTLQTTVSSRIYNQIYPT